MGKDVNGSAPPSNNPHQRGDGLLRGQGSNSLVVITPPKGDLVGGHAINSFQDRSGSQCGFNWVTRISMVDFIMAT